MIVPRLPIALRASVPLACILTLVACSDSPTAPSPVDRRFTLAPGESAQIAEAAVGVRFDGVTNDSRCPGDALCLLGGDALVHVTVLSGSVVTAHELHTGSMAPVLHGDLTVSLETLEPYPFSSLPPDRAIRLSGHAAGDALALAPVAGRATDEFADKKVQSVRTNARDARRRHG